MLEPLIILRVLKKWYYSCVDTSLLYVIPKEARYTVGKWEPIAQAVMEKGGRTSVLRDTKCAWRYDAIPDCSSILTWVGMLMRTGWTDEFYIHSSCPLVNFKTAQLVVKDYYRSFLSYSWAVEPIFIYRVVWTNKTDYWSPTYPRKLHKSTLQTIKLLYGERFLLIELLALKFSETIMMLSSPSRSMVMSNFWVYSLSPTWIIERIFYTRKFSFNKTASQLTIQNNQWKKSRRSIQSSWSRCLVVNQTEKMKAVIRGNHCNPSPIGKSEHSWCLRLNRCIPMQCLYSEDTILKT